MKTFNTYLTEAEDKVKAAEQKARVAIDGFLAKIEACKTPEGVTELEKFYKTRVKEVDITDAEDIQIRDALSGRKQELSSDDVAEPEEF